MPTLRARRHGSAFDQQTVYVHEGTIERVLNPVMMSDLLGNDQLTRDEWLRYIEKFLPGWLAWMGCNYGFASPSHSRGGIHGSPRVEEIVFAVSD
jgi:hypothetical protein